MPSGHGTFEYVSNRMPYALLALLRGIDVA
jgi:hypothetical protein